MSNGNAAAYFVDRHLQERPGDKTAFIEGERTLSYAALAAQSDRMAALYARHGIAREDRAAMIVLDVLEFPIIFWGSLKAGVVPVPVNTLLSVEHYRLILQDSRARALFVSAPLLAPLRADPALGCRICARSSWSGGRGRGDCSTSRPSSPSASRSRRSRPRPTRSPSGSIPRARPARPRASRHVHGSLQSTADTYAAQVLGIRADDLVFSAAKLFFAYGLGNAHDLSDGGRRDHGPATPARPTPDAVFATVRRRTGRPIFYGVPTLYAALLAKLEPARRRQRDACAAASPPARRCPPRSASAGARASGVDILDGVGSTEMLHIFLSNRPGRGGLRHLRRARCPATSCALVDEQRRRGRGRRRSASCWSAARPRPTATGTSATRAAAPSRATGRAPATSTSGRADGRLRLLRPHRRHVQGRRHLGRAVRGRAGADRAPRRARGGRGRPARDEHGLEKPKAFVVLKSRRAPRRTWPRR